MDGSRTRNRRVVVIPAGRRRYMKALLRHLHREHAYGSFDELRIWNNTTDADDLAYFCSLADEFEWITNEAPKVPVTGSLSIHQFFRACTDPATTYLRLDDDVVWLEDGFVEKMFAYRESSEASEFILVYGNIVNNAVVSFVQQRRGVLGTSLGLVSMSCTDDVGWKSPDFAEHVHRTFLRDAGAQAVDRWHFDSPWILHGYERASINCISWLGSDFAKFGGLVDEDEELFLSVTLPKRLGRKCAIYGGALCAHFSFYTQRSLLDKSDVLDAYYELAGLPPRTPSEIKEAEAEANANVPISMAAAPLLAMLRRRHLPRLQ
jgi:hypothetical protein